ncbi:type II toxin-antitoxin system VapB family antitoxin [Glycomyces sp. NPDC046736]|uniref:type II toxin-antitoxin system VapB family antitoxin n=1 Tax=Glycomyces sp. NPDC046736 TaxID=3155615 RepID=UPI0033D47A6B
MTKTLVDIDDELLADVMSKSGAKTKKQAINEALSFYAQAQDKSPEEAWRDLFSMVDEGVIDLDQMEAADE